MGPGVSPGPGGPFWVQYGAASPSFHQLPGSFHPRFYGPTSIAEGSPTFLPNFQLRASFLRGSRRHMFFAGLPRPRAGAVAGRGILGGFPASRSGS
jgi:hypothetical protein